MTGSSEAIHSRKGRVDCFVASAPLRKRFAFVADNDGGGLHGVGGEWDGSGGGIGSGRRGSRQAPALRPAIIQ